ncbi:MAG: Rpn family recombination-promoting nuclease/putative transposase, partial [Desulfotomaculaceae bacterium]|nr:Rpn family recombination-promoting nuclease/putative transposase [Desulfotomaculaceae bacterium]
MPEQKKTGAKPPHHPHDKGYKQLLTNKKTFLELLHTFVQEGWVQEIAEDDLILVNKSYILQDFSEKEADIVYRLRFRSTEIIFYVLLELQSTVDRTMPFRLLQYMVEIWRDIYNNTPEKDRDQKDYRLPAIIPAVLYNGEGSWTASPSFREYQSGQERFPRYLLDFSYILFDVIRYDEEDLYRAANVIASVFYLDRVIDPRELVKRIKVLAD